MTVSIKHAAGKDRGRALVSLALVLMLLVLLLCSCKGAEQSPSGTQAGTAAQEGTGSQTNTDPSSTEPASDEEIAKIDVYTVDDLADDDPRLEAVVATSGEEKLTNRQLQIYYSMQFFEFMNQYGMYAAYFGLDPTKPLSEQPSLEKGLSWEQFFAKYALAQFEQFAAVTAKAKQEGFTFSEENEKNLKQAIDGLDEQAEKNGFETTEAYVQETFGKSIHVADYQEFIRTYFYVMAYEDQIYDSITWTDEDLMAYFESHKEDNQEYQTISSTEQPNINVRHILIQPEDTDNDGATGEEEKKAALEKAKQLLETWKKDPTEENFAALAEANTTDGGSKNNGGLYNDVYPGQMVKAFNDWCFDADRKTGDTDIVETDYGYHIMYFVSTTDHYQWKILAERDYCSSRVYTFVDELTKAHPAQVDYSAIVLSPIPQPETTEE